MRITLIRTARKAHQEYVELKKGTNFGQSVSDYLVWLFKERDLTINGFRKHLETKQLDQIRQVNNFFDVDFARLGAELHAATYTVKLGGKFQLTHGSRWIGLDDNKDKKITDILPTERTQDFIVEGLDFSRTVIQENGLDNIELCQNLKTLIFKDCFFLDDWALTKLIHFNFDKLEVLDISGCQKITDNGLIMLSYLKNLKKLKIYDLKNIQNKEYISILLEEEIKGLEVEGGDHLSEENFKLFEKKNKIETS